MFFEKELTEYKVIKRLAASFPSLIRLEHLATVVEKSFVFPIYGLVIGSQNKALPTYGLFGGVHGLERIGSQVVLAYLNHLVERLNWDQDLHYFLSTTRLVSIPLVNPIGVARRTRSNGNGVDLMRNAPVEAEGGTHWPIAGHFTSNKFPFFRGNKDYLEKESQSLVDFVKEEMFSANVALSIDIHSGFGAQDQIWYPWAKSKQEYPRHKETNQFLNLYEKTHPHHIYKIEPQSVNYITHGDLWDFLFMEHQKDCDQSQRLFIPLTLELGSWSWVRKNPWQIFDKQGLYNPVKKHRYNRTMRRHFHFLEFSWRALKNHQAWL